MASLSKRATISQLGEPVWQVADDFGVWKEDSMVHLGGYNAYATTDPGFLRRLASVCLEAADRLEESQCCCGHLGPDPFGNYERIEDSECPVHR